jgi:hypothetical protein
MSQSFTIQREAVAAGDPSALLADIINATGSEIEAAGILRSLERMGTDPTIDFFEITPVTGRRSHGGPVTNTWRVHADRGVKETDESAV